MRPSTTWPDSYWRSAIAQIESHQQKEVINFGLITVIEQCVRREKKLILGVTSGTGEITEGPLSYSCGMDRVLKWSNSKYLKVDHTKGGKSRSIAKVFFPAPCMPYMDSGAYSGPLSPEAIEAVHWDMKREATGWSRTLTCRNSREGHLSVCENIYTAEKVVKEPTLGIIREMGEFEYLHGISDFLPSHVFAAVQPSKFKLTGSTVTQPSSARSHVSEGGTKSLRPGYLAAYTRSLLPAYMAYGKEVSMGAGLVASFVKARANIPNLMMNERDWAYFCFTAGEQDKDWPTLVCVHRGRHSAMQDFNTLQELNAHMATCFAKHEDLVQGKCSLGKLDFPEPRENSSNKKGKAK